MQADAKDADVGGATGGTKAEQGGRPSATLALAGTEAEPIRSGVATLTISSATTATSPYAICGAASLGRSSSPDGRRRATAKRRSLGHRSGHTTTCTGYGHRCLSGHISPYR